MTIKEQQEALNARYEARSKQGKKVNISIARSPESVLKRRLEIDADVVRIRWASDRKRGKK